MRVCLCVCVYAYRIKSKQKWRFKSNTVYFFISVCFCCAVDAVAAVIAIIIIIIIVICCCYCFCCCFWYFCHVHILLYTFCCTRHMYHLPFFAVKSALWKKCYTKSKQQTAYSSIALEQTNQSTKPTIHPSIHPSICSSKCVYGICILYYAVQASYLPCREGRRREKKEKQLKKKTLCVQGESMKIICSGNIYVYIEEDPEKK